MLLSAYFVMQFSETFNELWADAFRMGVDACTYGLLFFVVAVNSSKLIMCSL
jgi:hypothetical protein